MNIFLTINSLKIAMRMIRSFVKFAMCITSLSIAPCVWQIGTVDSSRGSSIFAIVAPIRFFFVFILNSSISSERISKNLNLFQIIKSQAYRTTIALTGLVFR